MAFDCVYVHIEDLLHSSKVTGKKNWKLYFNHFRI